MTKVLYWLHERECTVFQWMNGKCKYPLMNMCVRSITNMGGAAFSIGSCLLFFLLSSGELRAISIQSSLALLFSHVPVQLSKKLYPRKRPYQVIPNTITISRLLQDHSFPSGHTTATFSITTPLLLWNPVLGTILLPLSLSVALSRIYLGLHYPSDVLAGMLLGIGCGFLVAGLSI